MLDPASSPRFTGGLFVGVIVMAVAEDGHPRGAAAYLDGG
jgi:hypothetical protein